jgi:hypothetical protein
MRAFLLLLSGCVGELATTSPAGGTTDPPPDALQILTPANGEVLGAATVEVTGTAERTEVIVNGELTPVRDGRFATAVRLAEGAQTIEVWAGETRASVDVFVDSIAPAITIRSPEPGSEVRGSTLAVTGTVEDATLEQLVVFEDIVDVMPDGSFEWRGDVPRGAYRVRVSARDRVGHTTYAFTSAIVGEFAAPGTLLDRAARLELGASALERIADGVEPLLSPSAIEPRVLDANPIADGFYGHVDTQGYSHDALSIEVTPSTGRLTVRVRITGVRIPVKATLNLLPDVNGVATADAVVGTATFSVGASAGRPSVELVSSNVAFEGFLVDVSGLWSWFDRNVVTRAAEGAVRSSVAERLESGVPPVLEDALERIPTSQLFNVAGRTIRASGAVQSFVAHSGGLALDLDLGVEGVLQDDALVRSSQGSLLFGADVPPAGAPSQVRAAVSLDLLNAALHAAWATGAIDVTIEEPTLGESGMPLTVGTLEFIAPGVGESGLPADRAVHFHIRPELPAVIQPSRDGLFELSIADLRVRVFARSDADEIDLLAFSIALRAPVLVGITDNDVSLTIGAVDLMADMVGPDVGLPKGPALDSFLYALLSPLVMTYGRVEGLEIPQVFGFAFSDVSGELDRNYLVVEGQLRRE